jgi:hypothetical protein
MAMTRTLVMSGVARVNIILEFDAPSELLSNDRDIVLWSGSLRWW